MGNRARSKRNSGFTLVEVLATVAIMAILLSVSVVSVGQYMNTLKLTELDNAARAIYMAAQNRAVRLSNARRLSSLVDPDNDGIDKLENPSGTSGWHADDDIDILYYVSNAGGTDSPIIEELLARDDIDSALEKGFFCIVYDLKSGSVTDVFYAEKDISGLFTWDGLGEYATKGRSWRLLQDLQVGYYSGEVAENTGGGSYSPDTSVKPYLDVTIENTEKLTVTVMVKGEYAKFNAAETPDTSNLTVQLGCVGGPFEGYYADLYCIEMSIFDGELKGSSYEASSPDTNYYTYTWVLDSLEKSAGVYTHQFKTLAARINKLSVGQDFTVRATITHDGKKVSAEDTNNSLFAYIPDANGGGIAYIKNLRHLQNLDQGHSGKTISSAIQIADIEPSSEYDQFIPIGNEDSPFTGSYDGRGYTISGLSISGTNDVGLFGCVQNGAVRNVKVEGSKVNGTSRVGGIVGYSYRSTVENCTFSGSVEGSGDNVGGIVGITRYDSPTVQSCSFNGTVTGGSNVGGIVGYNVTSTVVDCRTAGEVSGVSYVGGIVGDNLKSVENCDNGASVSGTGNYVGGITGYNTSTVRNCGNKAVVESTLSSNSENDGGVGGVVGRNNSGTVSGCWNESTVKALNCNSSGGIVGYKYSGTVENCYNTGDVNGQGLVGGIVGLNQQNNSVKNCYNTGDVNGTGSQVGGIVGRHYRGTVENCYNTGNVDCNGSHVGGVTGFTNGADTAVLSCYFLQTGEINKNLKGIGTGSGTATALSELQFGTPGTFSGWTFNETDGTWVMASVEVCNHDDQPVCNRPILWAESEEDRESGMEVDLTADRNTYLIGCANALRELSNKVSDTANFSMDKIFKLTADIDLGGVEWKPIGVYDSSNNFAFKGIFDGSYENDAENHVISNLSININEGEYQGLFGEVRGGTIKNVTVKDSTVIGGKNVGGIAGRVVDGEVINCQNSANITGNTNVGGVVGSYPRTAVTGCTNDGTITGMEYVGGIAGSSEANSVTKFSEVTQCSNTGEVKGYRCVGGIVGSNIPGSTVSDCKNESLVSCEYVNGTYVGGIAGKNAGNVERCTNSGEITSYSQSSDSDVGGVVGYNESGTVTASTNSNTVTGISRSGGVVGYNAGGIVQNCSNTGMVTVGTGGYAGGIVGINTAKSTTPATVKGCWNKGEVSATGSNVGGIAGLNRDSSVENSYNIDSVGGVTNVGGVVGSNTIQSTATSTVTNCYNIGDVSGSNAGGVVGSNSNGTVEECYFLNTMISNGIGSNAGTGNATGKDAAEFGQLHETLGDAWEKGGPFSEEPTWRPILKENREPDPDPDPEP